MRFSSFSFYSETYIQGKARGVGEGTPMKSIDAKCEPRSESRSKRVSE